MLARLLRAVMLAWLALAAGWISWQLDAARPGWALAGVLVLALGYVPVLAFEFALMARANVHDAAPPATAAQRLRAFLGELRWAPLVFCWRQPFRARRWPDHLPADAAGRRGLLLVHGFVCNRGLWNRWYPPLRALGVPHVAVNLEPVFGAIDDYAPLIEAAVRRLEAATGLAPVAVAHSMGGLALRRWWAETDPGRLHHAVTIGSPHHGTALARFAFSANTRQMRRGSRWLAELAAREPAGYAQRLTCFYGHADHIVFPASTAVLPGARAVHLPAVAHVHMADHPAPLAEVLARLGLSRA